MRLDATRVFTTRVDDQTVVLDAADSTYLRVNDAGALLLEALQQEATEEQLVKLLRDRFDLDATTAHRDCSTFIDELRSRGWLAVNGDSE